MPSAIFSLPSVLFQLFHNQQPLKVLPTAIYNEETDSEK